MTQKYDIKNFINNLELRFFPDAVLREHSHEICTFDNNLQEFAQHMFSFMIAHNGIGLAAPQIGLLRRIITVDLENMEKVLINPVILSFSPEKENEAERCLSIPNQLYDISRDFAVEISAKNTEGKNLHFEVAGLAARVLQHEIDHLNGRLICDKGTRVENY